MEQPRSISIEGDQVAGQAYIPRAVSMLRRLRQRVELGGVQTASDHVRLDDNAYLYAIVTANISKAVIVVDGGPAPSGPPVKRYVTPQIPDFYSGAVLGGTIPVPPVTVPPTPVSMSGFWPTAACRALFPTLVDAKQNVTRLTVEPYADYSGDLANPTENGVKYSQYYRLKPTMYSGLMREVVQLLMGFGKQEKESIYDKAKPPIGKKPRTKPTKPTGYQGELASNGLQIRYDWRWHRTHGIARALDGRLWLIEIGVTRGIIAMPLPMNATSQLPAFRDKLDLMKDSAGAYAYDELGGYPTGESFPVTAIDSWVRAGKILRLASANDVANFYQHGSFSAALGWAFNLAGSEAHNTCVSFDDDGFQTAYHFAASWVIGKTKAVTAPPSAAALRSKLASEASDDRFAAVSYKIGRMPEDDVAAYVRRSGPVAELLDELDALVIDPQAVGSGSMREMTRGRLYKVGKTEQYDLKFPSYELGYLVSWDMQSSGPARFTGKCDTIVHVFFSGNQLKYVKFFNDTNRKPWSTSINDSDGCELLGTFTTTTTSGTIGIPAMVYTSDYDDRAEFTDGSSVNTRKGTSLGYSSVEAADDITRPYLAHISRKKRFRVDSKTDSRTGEFVSAAAVVPFDDRCAYYYALATGAASHTTSTSSAYKEITDPWSANTWRNFPGYIGRWGGSGEDDDPWYPISLVQHPDGCGPVTARTVSAPGAIYSPYNCSDFADSGSWIDTCDNADAKLYSIPQPPLPPGTNTGETNKVVVTAYLVNDSGFAQVQTLQRTTTVDAFANPWFLMSPDPESLATQYAEDTHSAMGTSNVMRYFTEPNGTVLTRGGPQPPGFANSNTTFVGVV